MHHRHIRLICAPEWTRYTRAHSLSATDQGPAKGRRAKNANLRQETARISAGPQITQVPAR
eukprot:2027073-Prymnesium_polylepis.1